MADEIAYDSGSQEILSTDLLMRWVHRFNAVLRKDGSFNKLKPGAFPLSPIDAKGFSMYLERLMCFEDCKSKAIEANALHIGIVRLSRRDFTDFQMDVELRPEDGEIAHCEVINYSSKTEDELTDVKRQWINRTKSSFSAF